MEAAAYESCQASALHLACGLPGEECSVTLQHSWQTVSKRDGRAGSTHKTVDICPLMSEPKEPKADGGTQRWLPCTRGVARFSSPC